MIIDDVVMLCCSDSTQITNSYPTNAAIFISIYVVFFVVWKTVKQFHDCVINHNFPYGSS